MAGSVRTKREKTADESDFADLMRHHRAAWRVERIGWTIMALLLVATLLGAFGDGPLSHARSGSAQGLSVEYDRLLRSSAPSLYRFEASPSLARDGVIRLRFDGSLIENMELESIVPEPDQQEAGAGFTEFAFRVAPGDTPARFDFRFRPATFGRRAGDVSIAGAHAVPINQFVYP